MSLSRLSMARRFDPRTLGSLLVWLDAGDSSTLYDSTTGGTTPAVGSGVARMEDKSGNGNHATQATANNRPVRRGSLFAGRDAIEFDGANDSLTIANNLVTTGGASIVVVSDKDASGQTSGLYTFSGNTGAQSNNHHGFTSISGFYDSFGISGGRPEFSQTERLDRYVWAVTASSAGAWTAYMDGEQKATDTQFSGASLGSGHSIGMGQKTGSYYYDGWICEVLIYSRVLTAVEVRHLYRQLQARWATT